MVDDESWYFIMASNDEAWWLIVIGYPLVKLAWQSRKIKSWFYIHSSQPQRSPIFLVGEVRLCRDLEVLSIGLPLSSSRTCCMVMISQWCQPIPSIQWWNMHMKPHGHANDRNICELPITYNAETTNRFYWIIWLWLWYTAKTTDFLTEHNHKFGGGRGLCHPEKKLGLGQAFLWSMMIHDDPWWSMMLYHSEWDANDLENGAMAYVTKPGKYSEIIHDSCVNETLVHDICRFFSRLDITPSFPSIQHP